MTGRPDDGYQVAARIQSHTGRHGRVAAILAGMVVVGWGALVVGGRFGSQASVTGDPGRSPAAVVATLRPPGIDGRSGPTFPPTVEIRQALPLGRVPIVLTNLAWIDPVRGTVQRTRPEDLRAFPFALPGRGAVCVCLQAGTSGSGPTLRLDRYDLVGQLQSARTIEGWLPNGLAAGLEDAVLVPDASAAVVASFVAVGGAWDLRIQRIPFEGTDPIVEREAPVDLATTADPAGLEVRAALAPDESRLRVWVVHQADDAAGIGAFEQGWDVAWDGSAWAAITELSQAGTDAQPVTCGVRAWATPRIFFEACLATQVADDGSQELLARIDDGSGLLQTIGLGVVPFTDPLGWVVDATAGVAYGWSAMSHHLYRIELPSGRLTLRVMGEGTLGGLSDLADVAPEATPPAAGPTGVHWQATVAASEAERSPLVGSSDGSLLYAAGQAFATGPGGLGGPASTGIWVFDARSLALVGHWQAAAAYDGIGLTPSGRYVLGLGEPNADEAAQFGSHGPELVIHDLVDGSVVAILRSLVGGYGGIPGLLPAGPPLG